MLMHCLSACLVGKVSDVTFAVEEKLIFHFTRIILSLWFCGRCNMLAHDVWLSDCLIVVVIRQLLSGILTCDIGNYRQHHRNPYKYKSPPLAIDSD